MRRILRDAIIVLMFILVTLLYFNGMWCSQSFKPSWARHAANWQFGFELNFDPDETDDGWPNLCATQQPFTVDTHVEPKHYAWQVNKGVVTLDNGTRGEKGLSSKIFAGTWTAQKQVSRIRYKR